MNRLFVVDTTLRDGEQTAGVAFSHHEKLVIAKALDNLGVDIIEAGIPAMGDNEIKVIKAISDLNLNAQILTWNRMCIKDIDMSLKTGVKNIHITVPSSDIHIKKKLKIDRDELIEQMKKVIHYAIIHECSVSIGAEDASRTDIDFLVKLYKIAEASGAIRLRYADTVGRLDPFLASEIISVITQETNIPIDFHGHNDLGMGTANALGAYRGGARYISCSVNGLGERAGNTPLEEIVTAIRYRGECIDAINMKEIMKVSKIVEKYSGRKLHKGKPIVGEGVFSHEAGIHIDGLLKDIRTYEEISPEMFGRQRKYVIGKHSGKYRTISLPIREKN